jgi:hypothetical protein
VIKTIKNKNSRNLESQPKIMTIDDMEQQIKAKINTIKKIMPTYGSGTFSHGRGDDERVTSPELFHTVVE